MKRLIALLLALCSLALLFAGCSGGSPIDEIKEKEKTETAESEKEETPAEDVAPEEPEPEAKPFELGTVNGDTYESRYFGIGFKGEGWVFDSEEDIAKENGITEDMTDEEIREVFENSTFLDDLGAKSEDNRSNIYMRVENLKLTKSTELDENAQADLYEKELRATVEQMQGENLILTRGLCHIGEDTHPAVNLEYDYQSLHVYQKAVFVREGDYLCGISITSIDEGGTDQVLEMFYKL